MPFSCVVSSCQSPQLVGYTATSSATRRPVPCHVVRLVILAAGPCCLFLGRKKAGATMEQQHIDGPQNYGEARNLEMAWPALFQACSFGRHLSYSQRCPLLNNPRVASSQSLCFPIRMVCLFFLLPFSCLSPSRTSVPSNTSIQDGSCQHGSMRLSWAQEHPARLHNTSFTYRT